MSSVMAVLKIAIMIRKPAKDMNKQTTIMFLLARGLNTGTLEYFYGNLDG